MYLIIKRLTFVNENQITAENWQQAVDLTTGIDVKDVSFVALAIQADAVLWTGDKKLYKGLKEKGFSNVVNREELRELIKR
ncbi:MAG: hypothetical protein IPJ00_12090 [Saprospirales bacterium]|nr:hypothetical protein [Saprospirales bacterium]